MPWSEKTAKEFSKTLSYYLRHAPWEAELIPDAAGWVSVEDLISALNDSYAGLVTLETLKNLKFSNDKDRFEISSDNLRIRAGYGHSFKVEPPVNPSETVPQVLYHGTTVQAAALIDESLSVKPIGRQYVHWTSEPELAKAIGLRHRGKKHVILYLDAKAAHEEGIPFYDCKNGIWLTPEVPSRFTTKGLKF